MGPPWSPFSFHKQNGALRGFKTRRLCAPTAPLCQSHRIPTGLEAKCWIPRCTMYRDRHVHLYTVYTCLYICYVRHIIHNMPCHAISYHVLHYIILQLNCIALHCVRTYVEYLWEIYQWVSLTPCKTTQALSMARKIAQLPKLFHSGWALNPHAASHGAWSWVGAVTAGCQPRSGSGLFIK